MTAQEFANAIRRAINEFIDKHGLAPTCILVSKATADEFKMAVTRDLLYPCLNKENGEFVLHGLTVHTVLEPNVLKVCL